jgi:hypothetical protein
MTSTISAAPHRLVLPSFVLDIGDTPVGLAGPVQLHCGMFTANVGGTQAFEDIETFCQPGALAPGTTEEMIIVDMRQSFGGTPAFGAWNLLKPLEGELVEFAFLPDSSETSSASNPEVSGSLWVPFIPFVNAGVKKFTNFNLEFKIFGIPAYEMTGNPVFDHPDGSS